jgi:hypothetical protein
MGSYRDLKIEDYLVEPTSFERDAVALRIVVGDENVKEFFIGNRMGKYYEFLQEAPEDDFLKKSHGASVRLANDYFFKINSMLGRVIPNTEITQDFQI